MIAHGNKIKLFAGNGSPELAKEIAKEMNLLEASVSRTFKQFVKLLKEEII